MNYITVTPHGYRFEDSKDVSGVRRKSQWVCSDLLSVVGTLEASLADRLTEIKVQLHGG